MSRPQSPRVAAALADVARGMTAYAAAKLHGVTQSAISQNKRRAFKRTARQKCPSCGNVIAK